MMKNEEGFVLPLIIAMTFVIAYLLLMLSTQIEVKVASYERTRNHMEMNVLEHEGLRKLAYFLQTADMHDHFSDTWVLRKGAIMTVSATRIAESFDFHYQIMYNGHVRSKNLLFCFGEGMTLLD